MNPELLMYPPFATWEVTPACNHLCIHCYNYWRGEECIPANCCDADMDRVAEFLIGRKPADITITGGEPLLIFEKLKKYIVQFRKHGISVRINCNGSLITDSVATFCAEHQVRMMISFPSSDAKVFSGIAGKNASMEQVLQGMQIAVKHGIRVSPNIVVSRLNMDSVETTCRYLYDKLKIDNVFISRVTRPINAGPDFEKLMLNPDEMDVLYRTCVRLSKTMPIEIRSCGGFPYCAFPDEGSYRLLAKSCGAGRNGYVIDNSGNIRVCVRDDKVYGNIFTQNFRQVWAAMAAWRSDSFLPKECENCNVRASCRGGCRISDKRDADDYCRLDHDARLDRIPVNYSYDTAERKIPLFRRFVVHPFETVEEQGLCRICSNVLCAYVPRRMEQFLRSQKAISLWSLMRRQKLERNQAIRLIRQLLALRIIGGTL